MNGNKYEIEADFYQIIQHASLIKPNLSEISCEQFNSMIKQIKYGQKTAEILYICMK